MGMVVMTTFSFLILVNFLKNYFFGWFGKNLTNFIDTYKESTLISVIFLYCFCLLFKICKHLFWTSVSYNQKTYI